MGTNMFCTVKVICLEEFFKTHNVTSCLQFQNEAPSVFTCIKPCSKLSWDPLPSR